MAADVRESQQVYTRLVRYQGEYRKYSPGRCFIGRALGMEGGADRWLANFNTVPLRDGDEPSNLTSMGLRDHADR